MGSYGEAVPFDLCYSPSLFHIPTLTKSMVKEEQDISTALAVEAADAAAALFNSLASNPTNEKMNGSSGVLSPTIQRLVHLRPMHKTNIYLTEEELDEANRLALLFLQ